MMEGWTWSALCNEAPFRFWKNFASSEFEPDLKTPRPVPDLEILLEVNLNFQVRLTIILACGIFSLSEQLGQFNVEI